MENKIMTKNNDERMAQIAAGLTVGVAALAFSTVSMAVIKNNFILEPDSTKVEGKITKATAMKNAIYEVCATKVKNNNLDKTAEGFDENYSTYSSLAESCLTNGFGGRFVLSDVEVMAGVEKIMTGMEELYQQSNVQVSFLENSILN